MGLHELYQERLAAQMRAWEAEIARLKAQVDIRRCDAHIAYLKKVESVQNRLYGGRSHESSGEALSELKEGVSSTFEKLRQTLGFADKH